ncbi:MAG: choline dehydrogenase [Hyphomonadaceae bacterium]|nr:MAG: choline dehydrogenase [Hyphomonadaceae bacterium]
MENSGFDYIIIGGGSAGCTLAARLTESGENTVLLLEAGGKADGLLVKMPAGVGELIKNQNVHNWGFETEPQKNCNNRKMFWPRGKGLGGSSSINAMLYVRGHAGDYDHWAQMGLKGWDYASVLPYFKKSENNESGGDEFHGSGGPLQVSNGHSKAELFKVFIDAGVAAGYPYTDDFNGKSQEGVGPYQMTINDGERWSTAAAFLRPALSRPNLKCETGAFTHRILIENGKAIGVEYSAGAGTAAKQVRCNKEVLLCAGAVQSPQILLLSGVGPATELQALGIEVKADSPSVGKNLQDHLDISVINECTKPITAFSLNKGFRQMMTGLKYLFTKQGLGRENFLESGGFLKSREGLEMPDLQYHFVNAVMWNHGNRAQDRDGYTLHVCQLRPESRGEITLKSTNPFDYPKIDANYLATEEDKRALREGLKMARKILAAAPFDEYRGAEFMPGAHVKSDADIDKYIAECSETLYHPIGTCRMGADEASVVDAELKVRGVAGLRVIDASIMPTLIGGNTNAPTIMIAEKAADMIAAA